MKVLLCHLGKLKCGIQYLAIYSLHFKSLHLGIYSGYSVFFLSEYEFYFMSGIR